MKNNQFFPFERNRYYAGKLLTSSDFESEQLYMNNKRHFINYAMFGSGIICGLNVVKIDDLSILVGSGAAIDNAGREIVVPSDVIKKLSGLEGYENIKTDRVKLFLRYKEDNVHLVYIGDMGTDGQEFESNRIDEGYELYLQDADQSDTHKPVDNNLFLKEKLLDNDDYTIFLSMPQTVAKGHAVKIVVNICKNSDAGKDLSFKAELQLPAFSDNKGRHELNISVRDLALAKGQTIQKEYWINCDYIEAKETNIAARKEDMQFTIGGYEVEPAGSLNLKVLLTELSPYKLATSEIGKTSLEENLKPVNDSGICIAELGLLRNDMSCYINDVTERGIKQYITTPGKMEQRGSFMSYFKNSSGLERSAQGEQSEVQAGINSMEMPAFMTSGRLEIPLDVNMKKGDVCYSEEIMHGLGKGNVYVEAGMEYLDDDPHSMNNRRNTIYGNPELFKFRECMEIETAVRVMNDKGSFQVAAKLLGEQKSIVIQLNWVAVKFTSMKDAAEMQEEDNRAIIPETPTVRLKARESYYFNVNFSNMKPCRLSYELTEAGSGEIGADGLYTAPSKEGVYEIYIYCTDMPKISTYVYAVVSR